MKKNIDGKYVFEYRMESTTGRWEMHLNKIVYSKYIMKGKDRVFKKKISLNMPERLEKYNIIPLINFA